MKHVLMFLLAALLATSPVFACEKCKVYSNSPDFKIKSASIKHNKKFVRRCTSPWLCFSHQLEA
jgi:hypothetical protein